MRSQFLLFVSYFLLYAISNSHAQVSRGGEPYTFTHQVSSESIEVKEMPKIDTEALLYEDKFAPENEPYRFGYGFDVSYSLKNSGTWEKLSDGGKLWRLKIKSQGAYSINLIYDKFRLPEGAKLFIYSHDKSMVIGAFTSRNNKSHGKFATGLVQGEEIILEYYESADVTQAGEISISRVVHAYRDFFKSMSKNSLNKTTGFGDSEDCNNNVHCPEAADWQDEVRSVGMIVLGDGERLCTGSLLNNVKENYAPYFLTANHCLPYGDLDTWVIWFNYESSTCANPQQEPTAQTLVGTSLKANNSASDFALLILDETPPLDYNVYYNGWSNINTASDSSVCIHHPSGDIKKISYENDQAISNTWSGTPANSHWQVTFDDGTAERGSSGAPLLNQNHRVVGQVHGGDGEPYCENRTILFGKFSISWNYGGSSSTRLRDWLDPDNTSATVLDGMEDGMLSAGELPANATWSGSHSLTGDVTVPTGITLTIAPSTSVNLNDHSITSTGGLIVCYSDNISPHCIRKPDSGHAYNSLGLYPTLQAALADAGSGDMIYAKYDTYTLTENLTVPDGVQFKFEDNSTINLASYYIKSQSTGYLDNFADCTINPLNIYSTEGAVRKGQFPTLQNALTNAATGRGVRFGGTRTGDFTLSKRLNIIGYNASSCIDGSLTIDNVTGGYVRLENFHLTGNMTANSCDEIWCAVHFVPRNT